MEALIDKIESTEDYNQKAQIFADATGLTFHSTFLRNGKHFDKDTDNRDIYEVSLMTVAHPYTFNFGQSISKSGYFTITCTDSTRKKVWPIAKKLIDKRYESEHEAKEAVKQLHSKSDSIGALEFHITHIKGTPPTLYDVLTCLTKNDPETFKDFCDNYGYDTDSISAAKTYQAVKGEWSNVQLLFTAEQIEALQYIN